MDECKRETILILTESHIHSALRPYITEYATKHNVTIRSSDIIQLQYSDDLGFICAVVREI